MKSLAILAGPQNFTKMFNFHSFNPGLMYFFEFGLGFFFGYLTASWFESFLHDRVHHARGRFFRLVKKIKYPSNLFWQAYRSHTLIHHKETFCKDHITQFTDSQHKKRVDNLLIDPSGRRIREENYGTTINWVSFLMFLGPPLPLLVFGYLFSSYPIFCGFLIPFFAYPLLSMFIHEYLHMPYETAIKKAPLATRILLKTRYIKFVWRHHWVHHRYPRYNFNLLFGGDAIRGVYRKPSPNDLVEMKTLGIPMD